ncbi:hypothetical protein JEU11_01250 [Paraglaciecola chathamensis]|uniref:PEP-CTERM sorting domain-containing protein n=1 Tax=Paraglaciecola chathamensis TaxID=368405 RepID=A0ABS0W8G3_9ALTE|nr:hypothetical protein [Paraglaciecola chathamensis]MBJ2135070.1 hypothetical protein [Paraglaciecola chathamensis]MDO6838806.1 hypothetical protein [Paraglaciecola chathamensis]
MSKVVKSLAAGALLGFSAFSSAAVLTAADYASIEVSEPSGWTVVDSEIDKLVDGDLSTSGNGRFAGRIGSADPLTSSNPFLITLNLDELFDVSKITLFTEWGTQRTQSVSELTLVALDTFGDELFNAELAGLSGSVGSFDPIDLFEGSLFGVSTLNFYVTGSNNDSSIEIREIQVEGEASSNAQPPVAVNAPASVGIFGLLTLALLRLRRK